MGFWMPPTDLISFFFLPVFSAYKQMCIWTFIALHNFNIWNFFMYHGLLCRYRLCSFMMISLFQWSNKSRRFWGPRNVLSKLLCLQGVWRASARLEIKFCTEMNCRVPGACETACVCVCVPVKGRQLSNVVSVTSLHRQVFFAYAQGTSTSACRWL